MFSFVVRQFALPLACPVETHVRSVDFFANKFLGSSHREITGRAGGISN